MIRLFTTLSVLLFLLVPTLSLESRADQSQLQTSTHLMANCADEMQCANNIMSCCVGSAVTSFYCADLSKISYPISFQKITYLQYMQLPLVGIKSLLYRPPIV